MLPFSLSYYSSVLLSCWVFCAHVVYALTNGCSMKINEIGCWNALAEDQKSILDFLNEHGLTEDRSLTAVPANVLWQVPEKILPALPP